MRRLWIYIAGVLMLVIVGVLFFQHLVNHKKQDQRQASQASSSVNVEIPDVATPSESGAETSQTSFHPTPEIPVKLLDQTPPESGTQQGGEKE